MLHPLRLPILSGPATIRAWTENDAAARFALFLDSDIIKYVGTAPRDLEQSTAQMRRDIQLYTSGEAYRLSLCCESGTLVGFISIQAISTADPRLELVIGISSEFRGKHIGAAASRALLTATFNANVGFDHVFGRRKWRNCASRRLLRSLQMRYVGLERSSERTYACPDLLYSIDRATLRDA